MGVIVVRFLIKIGNWIFDRVFGVHALEKELNKILLKEAVPSTPIPTFKYHPNPLETMSAIDVHGIGKGIVCDCCKKRTIIYTGIIGIGFIPNENSFLNRVPFIPQICLHCISNGSAAVKFDGIFIDPDASDTPINDPQKRDELAFCTPGSLNVSLWLTCCNDYCALIDQIADWHFIEIRGIERQIKKRWIASKDSKIQTYEDAKNAPDTHDVFLFRCIHCRKHSLYITTEMVF